MQSNGHHLAELNVGRLIAPMDDPRVAEQAACRGRSVMVSMVLGSANGAGLYEVLCARGR